jgi:hypothetical protein
MAVRAGPFVKLGSTLRPAAYSSPSSMHTSPGRLAGDSNCLAELDRSLTSEPVAQRFAIDVRHRKPELIRALTGIVDDRM